MGYFPIFIDLKDKECLIIGGGKVALRKAETLLKYDAKIEIISPVISKEILQLNVCIKNRKFKYKDLDNKDIYLVVATTNNKELNSKILEICKKKNILCNSSTNRKDNGYIFPSTIKQGDISIGISTSGGSPYISKKIRKDIESNINPKYEEVLELSNKWRQILLQEISNDENRKKAIIELIENSLIEDLTEDTIQQIVKKYR